MVGKTTLNLHVVNAVLEAMGKLQPHAKCVDRSWAIRAVI